MTMTQFRCVGFQMQEFPLHITGLHLTYNDRFDQNPSGQTWTTWSCSSPGIDILKWYLSTRKHWRKSEDPNWEWLFVFSFWFIFFKCFSSKFRSPKSSTLAPSRRLILSRKNTNNMLEFSCNIVKTEATFQRISNIGKTVEKRIKKAHCKKADCQSQPHVGAITKEAHSILHLVNFLTPKNTTQEKHLKLGGNLQWNFQSTW